MEKRLRRYRHATLVAINLPPWLPDVTSLRTLHVLLYVTSVDTRVCWTYLADAEISTLLLLVLPHVFRFCIHASCLYIPVRGVRSSVAS